jgi:hypothetical protein
VDKSNECAIISHGAWIGGTMNGHSDFQIDHFIVNKGNWTPYGQLKQIRREIEGRERSLAELAIDLEEKRLDLEECADTPRGRLQARRVNLAIQGIQESIATTERELTRFREMESTLDVSGDESDLDREMWLTRLRVMLALDLLCNGRPSSNLMTLVLSTPPDFRRQAITEVMQVVAVIRNGDIPQAIEQACKLIES